MIETNILSMMLISEYEFDNLIENSYRIGDLPHFVIAVDQLY